MSGTNTEALVKAIVDNKLYLGTPKANYFPKVTDKVILGEKNRQIVIDPAKIAELLEKAKEVVSTAKKEGKDIVVVFDKEAFRDDVENLCESLGIMYLNAKVPSGFFTNFDTFSKRIHSMNKLRKYIESGEFLKLTKKEQLMKKRELKKLEDIYKGVTKLNKLPDLVVVVDAEYYLNTVDELEKAGIDYVAIANTDLSKWLNTDNLVVANTNSYESVSYLLNYILK
jgi:small subunit ribosomal protein S2